MRFLLLLLFTITSAHAGDLQLWAGGGVNLTGYKTRSAGLAIGEGLNFKTDLGWCFDSRWALEWSSQVKFNKQDEFLIWDTLMTIGIRHQFKDSPWYVRGFFGRSPTVVYLHDAPEVSRRRNASRIQFDGPVVGASVGKIYKTKSGKLWFLEGAFSHQYLSKETGINNDGEIPRESFNQRAQDPVNIYSVYFQVGFKIF